jgi:hypothetical protein
MSTLEGLRTRYVALGFVSFSFKIDSEVIFGFGTQNSGEDFGSGIWHH